MPTLRIRPETAADRQAVWDLHCAAFGAAAEADLVDALRDGGYARVSLVAEADGAVIGHILFSHLTIVAGATTIDALSLAPLAVAPDQQRQGIGSQLVRSGLHACRSQGHRVVIVLGHPHFYRRFGFSSALAQTLTSPFGGGEAWMALELVPDALAGIDGAVVYPPPFLRLE